MRGALSATALGSLAEGASVADKVVLISGASAGLGLASAETLAREGHRVYGTSRRAQWPTDPLVAGRPALIPMDVTRDDSVESAVRFVLEREGRLDVVVNNAGMGVAGAIEDTSVEEAQSQLDTNLFGVHRVCRAVLPTLRAQGRGLVINVSSIGGIVTIPFQGFYSASKFALEAYSDALRMEVAPFGIDVCLIEPGDFRTGFSDARQRVAAHRPDSAYYEAGQRAIAAMDRDERSGADPREVARLVARLVEMRSPPPRSLAGAAIQKSVVWLKRGLSTRMIDWLLRKNFGV